MKNYYELLELTAMASADEIKKAFRAQIAKYHPDKVQHLGKEFQVMAADRAAELTEAWRILSDAGRRSEYDRVLNATPAAAESQHAGTSSPSSSSDAESGAAEPTRQTERPAAGVPPKGPGQFVQERASRDVFVRKATIDRFRQAFTQVAGSSYDETKVRGFDFASVPRSKLFSRGRGVCLLGGFVPKIDAASLADAWGQAGRSVVPACEEICVILMATTLAPARELADAIADQRRRSPRGGPKITLIPVNSSVWDAHMPTDAPEVAKDLLARLRSGK